MMTDTQDGTTQQAKTAEPEVRANDVHTRQRIPAIIIQQGRGSDTQPQQATTLTRASQDEKNTKLIDIRKSKERTQQPHPHKTLTKHPTIQPPLPTTKNLKQQHTTRGKNTEGGSYLGGQIENGIDTYT